MKKIITAVLNQELNNELNSDNICVLEDDIQYQEAVLEILENNNYIDFLLLNYNIPGEYDIFKFIEKIKEINYKIKIIIFIDKKDENKKNKLYSKGIFYIFTDGEININKLKNLIIKENNESQEIKDEIENLKNIILENKFNKKNEKNLIKKIIKILKIIKN
ncbi:MAG: hypothetical protein IKG42_06410 [Clostridia bacterium]|nr:hypothetical protein [Clostridia bacterium]